MTALLLGSAAALAHGGEDHSHDKPAATVTTTQPRVSIHSEQYELVGVLRGPWLDVYLDHFGSNEPVTGAKIAATIGDKETTAEPSPDGTYKVASAKFGGSGPLELVFAVTARSGDDLLVGTLTLPDKEAAPVASASTLPTASWSARLADLRAKSAAWVAASPALGQIPPVVMVLTFALGLAFGLLLRGKYKWRLVPATALALMGLLVLAGVARAHEGEDHGNDSLPRARFPLHTEPPASTTVAF
jgi:hypothetical protein